MLSRSARSRVLDQAVIAWRVGKPHRAWEILHENGLQDYWSTFLKTATTRARKGYIRSMSRYAA